MIMIKIIQKYLKLENIYNTNIDICHILMLETLLNEPNKWFNCSHFESYLTKQQYSTTTRALSGSIKDSINNVRIHEKSLYWLDKRTSKFNKRMNEYKISSKGIKDLSSYQ
jgi:hypothetical protein